MINNETAVIWDSIRKMGNFSDSYYDQNIEQDMKNELGLSESVDLRALSPEKVLSAFFTVMSPLSSMYEDILNLFEKCKANRSETNIKIKFESSKISSTTFNLQHFIQAQRVLTELKSRQNRVLLNEKALYKLWGLTSGMIRIKDKIDDELFNEWSQKYDEDWSKWPETKLNYECKVQGLPIKDELLKAYCFWKELNKFYRETGIERTNWSESADQHCADWNLLGPETNCCLRGILYNLYFIAENYELFSDNIKRQILEALESFLRDFQIQTMDVTIHTELWQEFLRLPVWKKRHEIYSIWVFTKIISAFETDEITFFIEDEMLIFPFSGACLASANINGKKIDIWTELRTTTFVSPIGKGRKKAIQPDYSIICGNPHDILDTIVVIECKQYKKANIKNFSEAIIDYTVNRPKAKVLLVDYGEVRTAGENFRVLLKSVLTEKYDILSQFRPGYKDINLLQRKIREEIYTYVNVFNVPEQCRMSFQLVWQEIDGEQDTDLDLHLRFFDNASEKGKTLSYNLNEIVGAKYLGDVRTSPGMECITIQGWQQGVYELWVNYFSGSENFGKEKPLVIVRIGDFTKVIQMKSDDFLKNDDKHSWWHVLTIDTKLHRGYVVNERCLQCFSGRIDQCLDGSSGAGSLLVIGNGKRPESV